MNKFFGFLEGHDKMKFVCVRKKDEGMPIPEAWMSLCAIDRGFIIRLVIPPMRKKLREFTSFEYGSYLRGTITRTILFRIRLTRRPGSTWKKLRITLRFPAVALNTEVIATQEMIEDSRVSDDVVAAFKSCMSSAEPLTWRNSRLAAPYYMNYD